LRKFWWRIAITALALGAVLTLAAALHDNQPPQVLATVRVDAGPVVSHIRATGNVSSTRDVKLSVLTSGPVQSVSVAVGGMVRPGDELLRLDAREARLQLVSDELAVREMEANIAHQSRTLDGLRADLMAGAVSREQVRQAEDSLRLLRIQQEKVAARASQTKARLQQFALRSPIGGIVTDVSVRPGEVAVAGQPVITLSDTQNQQILARMEQNDAQDLGIGMPVRVSVEGAPGQVLEERIVRIEPSVRREGSASYTAVWISLGSNALKLRPNQQVDVRVPIGTGKAVVRLPLEALASRDGKTAVWTLDDLGRLKLLPITIGTMGDRFAEVLSGVSPGQFVALAEGRTLKEGEAARAAKAASAP